MVGISLEKTNFKKDYHFNYEILYVSKMYKTTPKVNAQLHIPIQKTFKRKYCFEIE